MLDNSDVQDVDWGNGGDSLLLELDTKCRFPAISFFHYDSNQNVNFERDFGGPEDCFFRWSIFPALDTARVFNLVIHDLNIIMDNYDTGNTDEVLDAVDRITQALKSDLKTVGTGTGNDGPECRCVCRPNGDPSPEVYR